MTTRRTALAALTLTLAVSLAGCGSSDDPSSSTPSPKSDSPSATASPTPSATSSPQAAPAVITIKDFEFTTPSTVKAGATVMIKNEDSEAHTVTADKGGFDVKIDPGATATLTAPSTAGRFPFHCTYHSDMHGTLTVS